MTSLEPDPTVTEPIPVIAERPRWRDTVAALRSHNYRLYVVGQLFANTGGWMARIAIDWLVLELSGNVALVGLVVALQFAPTLLLGPWAGVVSDRYRRHAVLLITQSVGTLANGALAVLTLTGVVQVWQVFLVAGVTGVSMAIDAPSRSAFVSEMVGTGRLRSAISLNASIFHLGGLLGPAVSGILIALVGSGWSIAINSSTSAIALTALLLMRTRELIRVARPPRHAGQVREALRYLRGKPTIFWPMLVMGSIAMFGMNLPVLFTASANDHWNTGSAGYGLYSSMAAVGAFAGALLSTRRKSLRLRGLVLGAAVYGLVTVLAGVAPWQPLFLGAVVGIGLARVSFMIAAESLTQLSTNLSIRGRVMSFWIMINMGGQAIGGVVMGVIVEAFGPSVGFVVAGGVPTLTAVSVAVVLARRHQLRLRVDLPWRGRAVRIVQV